MKWIQMPLGPLQTNAYILSNDQKECVIFDPGSEGEKLVTYLQQEGLKPLAILLTHAHFDHIGAVDAVREAFRIPVYVHKEEAEWLGDPAVNGSQIFMMNRSITAKPADYRIDGEGTLTIGPFTFEMFETPGHSPGSISYYCKEVNAVFSGDVLFQMSIGRTDLPGGSLTELMGSIEEKLFMLPDDTTVLCGHGPETNIGFEKENNPFLQ
ncbi:MBL fold metallo-hydrolase [Bacillus cytotoxicus]|uniref:Beta-lactamase domain protein n=2 Tax=Bacillus cytotoxicus TaxID=580165 RepID=A0AAX2CLA8_9BACI|nr:MULTISPECIES: MBL fold metallo-hydrolase [Bacillus cereus group]ABS23216.1 beta-lactamase domain protein [Bacillus cytotoxicus NVH 391-98]AWC29824.1 MBL fold metallo-hydrolase [Bacillus cytotoxicus]AWC33863.1 MBL fold metallo-hydrolase [Bacillus cytotoxicus]AWC41956.1 MBL fold metallo-hydrolase [Bacillus cytotoxicus]AWC45843.1 MBL fold metallo-hydrolase [Bacillus cytotoxicus]